MKQMAARAFLRPSPSPPTFWHLPSHIRAEIYHNVSSRSFSSTPRPAELFNGDFAVGTIIRDTLIAPPRLLLEALHGYLPWWAVIPAAAVILRGLVGYHFGSKQAHERSMMRTALIPLGAMHKATLSKASHQEYRTGTRVNESRHVKGQVESFTIDMRLRKTFGAQYITGWSFVNIALILSTSEAIREKTGANDGLLSLAARLMGKVSPFAKRETAEEPALEECATREAWTSDSVSQVTSLGELIDTVEHVEPIEDLAGSSAAVSNVYDPTTAVEGLSFCTDLTVPDPTGYLANALLFVMVLNVVVRPSRAYSANMVQWLRTFNSWDAFLICLSILFWQFAVHIPAGLYLYFISTTVVGRMTTIYSHFKHPIPAPLLPCRRIQKGDWILRSG